MIRSLEGQSCLVIGGAGNLGTSIIDQLHQRKAVVTSFDRLAYSGGASGVKSVIGDICDREALAAVMKGHSVVFHTASVIDIRPVVSPNMHRINVEGTENVVACSKATTVGVLIYTSSMEVCSGSSGDSHEMPDYLGADETVKIPDRHCLPYAATKAAAEACVLAANSRQLKTIALRPGLILGPGYISARLEMPLCAARSNKYITAQIDTKMNCVCSHNCAVAHVKAAERADLPGVAGTAFFLNDKWANVVDVNSAALAGAGIKTVLLPLWFANGMARFLHVGYKFVHWIYSVLRVPYEIPSHIADFRALGMIYRNLCFSASRAKELLDVDPAGPGMKSWEQTAKEQKQWVAETYPQILARVSGKSKGS